MIAPLAAGKADCVIGYISVGRFKEVPIFRHVCGNRSYFRKDLIPYLKEMENKRRGVELFLNHEFSQRRKKIILVPLEGLKHRLKPDKRTAQEALLDYIREGYELATEYARQKRVSGAKRTAFVKAQMVRFLKDYARYFKLTPSKLKALIDDLLSNFQNQH